MKEAVSDLNEELIGSTEQKKNQSIDALLKISLEPPTRRRNSKRLMLDLPILR